MPEPALSDEDTQALIAYARQKFAEERYPLSPALQPVREALAKLDPQADAGTPARAEAPCAEHSDAEEAALVSHPTLWYRKDCSKRLGATIARLKVGQHR